MFLEIMSQLYKFVKVMGWQMKVVEMILLCPLRICSIKIPFYLTFLNQNQRKLVQILGLILFQWLWIWTMRFKGECLSLTDKLSDEVRPLVAGRTLKFPFGRCFFKMNWLENIILYYQDDSQAVLPTWCLCCWIYQLFRPL